MESVTGMSLTDSLSHQLAALAGRCKQLGERVVEGGVPLNALTLATLMITVDGMNHKLAKLARRLHPGHPEGTG